MEIESVPMSEINGVSDLNIRKGDPVQNLESLKDSIADIGIQQPLLLRDKEDGYWVVAGRRRYTTAKELEFDSVPARVKDISDDEAFKLSATENIQSESLTAPQKKRLVQHSLNRYGSLDLAADEMAKNKQTLRRWEPFLTLPDEVLQMAEEQPNFFEQDARAIGENTGSAGGAFESLAVERAELMSDLSKKEKEQVENFMRQNPHADRDELEQMLGEETTPVEIEHEITGNGAEALREEAESKPYDVEPEQLAVQQINDYVDEL
jgi:ParB family chromosome partitioning protein